MKTKPDQIQDNIPNIAWQKFPKSQRIPESVEYFRELVQWTTWQIAYLESYEKDPTAPENIHYIMMLLAIWKELTTWQEAYLESYEEFSRAPTFSTDD